MVLVCRRTRVWNLCKKDAPCNNVWRKTTRLVNRQFQNKYKSSLTNDDDCNKMSTEALYNRLDDYDEQVGEPEGVQEFKCAKTFIVLHCIFSTIFAITSVVGLSYSFEHCNQLMNGLFVLVLLSNVWSAIVGIARLSFGNFSVRRGFVFVFCFIQLWIAGVFTLVSFMDGTMCNGTVLRMARVLSSLLLVYSMFLFTISDGV